MSHPIHIQKWMRDTQLSRLLYEPKFNNIDPGKCGDKALEFECGVADEFAGFTNDFNPIIKKIKKALNNDITFTHKDIKEALEKIAKNYDVDKHIDWAKEHME